MSIEQAIFKLTAGATLRPPQGFLADGRTRVGIQMDDSADPTYAMSWRVLFGGAGAMKITGTVVEPKTTAGVLQSGDKVMTGLAAASAGTLNIIVTAAGVAGSPLTLPLAVAPNQHGTTAALTAAIQKRLESSPALMALYRVVTKDDPVYNPNRLSLRRRYPAANDTTLDLTWAAAGGIPANTGLTDRVAGVANPVIESIQPGWGRDVYNQYVNPGVPNFLVAFSAAATNTQPILLSTTTGQAFMPALQPGGLILMRKSIELPTVEFSSLGNGEMHILLMGA